MIPRIYLYGDDPSKLNDVWIEFFLRKIKNNQNNLITVTGKTGSGKTWSAISICEKIAKINGTPFGIDQIVFNLLDLIKLVRSGLPAGSGIVIDEPQLYWSARDFQTEANRIFNWVVTTCRYKNINMFFCTPYSDLLDKTGRKLFHAEFETVSIDRSQGLVKLSPKSTIYSGKMQKFYTPYLRVYYLPKGSDKYTKMKVRYWDIPKPSPELVKLYEEKKAREMDKVYQDAERRLTKYEVKEVVMIDPTQRLSPTPRQQQAVELYKEYKNLAKVGEAMGTTLQNAGKLIKAAKIKRIAKELTFNQEIST